MKPLACGSNCRRVLHGLALVLGTCASLPTIAQTQANREVLRAADVPTTRIVFGSAGGDGVTTLSAAERPTPRLDITTATRRASPQTDTRTTHPLSAPLPPNFREKLQHSTETVTLATWTGGSLTDEELSKTLQYRRPARLQQVRLEDLADFPPLLLREIVRDLVYEQIVYERGLASGIDERYPEIARRLKEFREGLVERTLYEELVAPRILETDEKSLQEFYEERKGELFTIPRKVAIRAIHVPTYLPYTTRQDDTSASVAQAFGGNERTAQQILRGQSPHFYRFPFPGSVPPMPLRSGESLLIPVSGDEVTSAQNVAAQIRERLASGDNFGDVATSFPQASIANGGDPFLPETTGVFPELAEAAYAPDATTISEVIKTSYGFDVIEIVARESTRTLSFEQVRDRLVEPVLQDPKVRQTNDARVRLDVGKLLAEKFGLTIHQDILKRENYSAPEPLTGNTPIASAPGFAYTLDDFLRDLRIREQGWGNLNFEQRMDTVRQSPKILKYLFQKEAESRAIDRRSDIADAMRSRTIQEIAGEYLRREEAPTTAAFEAKLREFYAANKDQFTSPAQVTLREITKRVNLNQPAEQRDAAVEAAKRQLEEVRKGIRSEQDFVQAARRESQAIATRSRGGLIGEVPIDFRGAEVSRRIQSLKPGEVSEPFLYGAEVMLLRVDSMGEPRQIPFEEAMPSVRAQYAREAAGRRGERQQQVLQDYGFELKF